MGLDEEICRQNLVRILEQVKKCNNFLRIDMEDTPYTDITISLYQSMLRTRISTQCHVGLVLQAYLYRTEADFAQIARITERVSVLSKVHIRNRQIRPIRKKRIRMRIMIC